MDITDLGLTKKVEGKLISAGLCTVDDLSGMTAEGIVEVAYLSNKVELNEVHRNLRNVDTEGLVEFDEKSLLSHRLKSLFTSNSKRDKRIERGQEPDLKKKNEIVLNNPNPVDPDKLRANIVMYESALDGDTVGLEKMNAERMGTLATLHDAITRSFIKRGSVDLQILAIDLKTGKVLLDNVGNPVIKGFVTPSGDFKAWESLGKQLGFNTKSMVLSPEAEGKKRGKAAESAVDDFAAANEEMDRAKNASKTGKTLPFSAKNA